MKKTIRCLSLVLALILTGSAALAATFRTQVSNILKEWEETDAQCETAELCVCPYSCTTPSSFPLKIGKSLWRMTTRCFSPRTRT